MTKRRVVVTGFGVVSPFGVGKKVFWDNVTKGNSAASLIKSFDTSELPTKFCAPVQLNTDELDRLIENRKALKTMSRSAKFSMIAADEAVKDSGLDINSIDPFRFGTSLGTGGLGLWDIDYSKQLINLIVNTAYENPDKHLLLSNIMKNAMKNIHPLTPLKALSNISTTHIAIKYNAKGNCQTIATACTSSTQAIGEAYRQIKFGVADVMIAGGDDTLINPNGLASFSMLGVLSKNNDEYKTASRPFDKRRDGFMVGEGASIFILEDYEFCKKREGNPYAEITGYASTNDAYRLTDGPPDAAGSIKAINIALEDAKLSNDKIDYINAHGTGTQMNDKNETFAIKSVFKENAYSIPVSSTKSMIGHLIAAAGCVELAVCILALQNQVIPPTINYKVPDEDCDLDYVPNNPRDSKINTILSNSFGFGGQNACLIISKI